MTLIIPNDIYRTKKTQKLLKIRPIACYAS